MTRLKALRRSGSLLPLLLCALAWMGCASRGHAAVTTCTVNTTADDPATASATVNTSTNSGTLRDCILVANLLTASTGAPTFPGLTINFAGGLSGATIALDNALPMLFNNTVIDASALASAVIIDGGSAHRIFLVSGLPSTTTGLVNGKPDPDGSQATTVTLRKLKLQHGLAQGGDALNGSNGTNGGGGGGMGAGGALLVNKSASVLLDRVSFAANAAAGGSLVSGSGFDSGGGGGMGPGMSRQGGGGLGAPSVSASGAGVGTSGTAGGTSGGWGGQGVGQISNAQGFDPAKFDVDSGSGTSGTGLIGGGTTYPTSGFGALAGFGGGASVEGKGGFGGGGGNGTGHDSAGGFGGGSGSYGFAPGGFGGGGGSGNSGGGVGGGAGGGGAGFGGAVFVRAGAGLTVEDSGTSGVLSGGNVAPGTGANNGAAAGSGMFLMTGANTIFDVAGRYTISDALADDSLSTLPASQSYTPGNGAGAAITKQGAGTLVLAGANTYAGTTNVNGGILRVVSPGSIQKSSISVVAAGTLTGDGTVGPVNSFGTIAPGSAANPQGTLHVIGALHVQLDALTCFHADGANAISDISATGAITLNGIARVDFTSGPSVGTTYFPLSASSISGTFAGYETNMPNLLGHFTYGASLVTFTVDASDVLFRTGFESTVNDSPCIAAFAN